MAHFYTICTTNQCEKMSSLSSMGRKNFNPRPSEHESLPFAAMFKYHKSSTIEALEPLINARRIVTKQPLFGAIWLWQQNPKPSDSFRYISFNGRR